MVINNNSTDSTKTYLDGLSIANLVIVHLEENIGGAGGFEVGMERGYALGADFVWVMDDDCYPESPALRLLLERLQETSDVLERDVPFACSLVKAMDGALCEMNNPITAWDWPRAHLAGVNAYLVTECTFVSVLVPRYALAEEGLPLRAYFIWYDDKEFTKRLAGTYGSGIVVLDSEVIHDMGVNAGVNYREINDQNIWKFEMGARNQASYRLRREGGLSYVNYFRQVVIQMRNGDVSRPLRKRMRKAMMKAIGFNPKPRFPESSQESMPQQ